MPRLSTRAAVGHFRDHTLRHRGHSITTSGSAQNRTRSHGDGA